MAFYNVLPERVVLAVTGSDAESFLQGLITNDVRKAGLKTAIFAALLSPQGKFLHDFFILRTPDGFWLETDREGLPALRDRLMLYKLRAQVEIAPVEGLIIAAVWGEKVAEVTGQKQEIVYPDPRLPTLGLRMIQREQNIPASAVITKLYHKHRLSLGIPEGSRDLIPDRSLILEYGYDELNAVDYAKGCYVGQEVTARMKHRANLNKFIHVVEAEDMLPAPGTAISAEKRDIGELRASDREKGLALLRAEETARAMRLGLPVLCGSVKLKKAVLPAWCKTSFGDIK